MRHYEITGRGLLVLSILVVALVLGAISVSAAFGGGTDSDAPDLPVSEITPMSSQTPDNKLPDVPSPTPEPVEPDGDKSEESSEPVDIIEQSPTPEPIVIATPTPEPVVRPTPTPTPSDGEQPTPEPVLEK